jgi:putative nucleotidyltransferase with HDIG domain
MTSMTEKTRLFHEIDRALMREEQPSKELENISRDTVFREYPFQLLEKLKHTGQSQRHHPEGSVWNHTMLVADEAAKRRKLSKDESVFMWAALLHDIGKPATTRERGGRFTAYGHDDWELTLRGSFCGSWVRRALCREGKRPDPLAYADLVRREGNAFF